MFSELCGISVGVIGLYALLIFFVPDWFFGTYLYKEGVWNEFQRALGSNVQNRGIVKHLLWGVSLSWISWGGVGYLAAIHYVEDPASRQAFATGNAVLWVFWVALDNYIRYQGLYSKIASGANLVLTLGMTGAWIAVAADQ